MCAAHSWRVSLGHSKKPLHRSGYGVTILLGLAWDLLPFQNHKVLEASAFGRMLRLQSVTACKTRSKSTSPPPLCADCVLAFEPEVSKRLEKQGNGFHAYGNMVCSRTACNLNLS
jgi:hypothetical protein